MPKTPLLTDVAQFYLDIMRPDHRAQLEKAGARATAEGRPVRIGTACSGTESPIVVFRALANVLAGVMFEHVFSCEVCPKKRAWIYENFDVPLVFHDIRRYINNYINTSMQKQIKHRICSFSNKYKYKKSTHESVVIKIGRDLCNEFAFDAKSGEFRAVPAVDIFIAGFVCKSVSSQNQLRCLAKDCIRAGSGLTGGTFKGVVDYVLEKKPAVVILENVIGLTSSNQGGRAVINDVADKFTEIDYAFAYRLLNTSSYLLPHRRNRCWMWAFRGRQNQVAVERAADMTCGLAQERFWTMSELFCKVGAAPMMPPKSCLKREMKVLSGVVEKVKKKRKVKATHKSCGIRRLVVDVGQSESRAGHFCVDGAAPCLLPNSKILVRRGMKILSVQELMALQGIFKADFPTLDNWAQDKKTLSRDLTGNAFSTTTCLAVALGAIAEGPLGNLANDPPRDSSFRTQSS